jgi:hypothetical protein
MLFGRASDKVESCLEKERVEVIVEDACTFKTLLASLEGADSRPLQRI